MEKLVTTKNIKIVFNVLLILIIIFSMLICVSLVTYNIDKQRALNGETPKFIISKNGMNDGGTVMYYGFGYQIITWKQFPGNYGEPLDDDIVGYYYIGIEFHYLFNMIDPMQGPSIELDFVHLNN